MEAPAPVNVGERIKALREDKRMSLRVLSKKSGISANALSLIERSKTSPTVSTLIAIACAFDISVHELFSDSDSMPAGDTLNGFAYARPFLSSGFSTTSAARIGLPGTPH